MSTGYIQPSSQLQVLHTQFSLSSGHILHPEEMLNSVEAQEMLMLQKKSSYDRILMNIFQSTLPALQTQYHSTYRLREGEKKKKKTHIG